MTTLSSPPTVLNRNEHDGVHSLNPSNRPHLCLLSSTAFSLFTRLLSIGSRFLSCFDGISETKTDLLDCEGNLCRSLTLYISVRVSTSGFVSKASILQSDVRQPHSITMESPNDARTLKRLRRKPTSSNNAVDGQPNDRGVAPLVTSSKQYQMASDKTSPETLLEGVGSQFANKRYNSGPHPHLNVLNHHSSSATYGEYHLLCSCFRAGYTDCKCEQKGVRRSNRGQEMEAPWSHVQAAARADPKPSIRLDSEPAHSNKIKDVHPEKREK